MTSREQFEEWVTKETGFDLWRTEFPMTEWDEQQYKCHQTNLAWMAWQASRTTVEIMMPEPFQMANSTSGLSYYYEKEVDDALRRSGIKVKE
ncbi:hypothetical protein GMF57_12275 [Salmonella enterica]|nr:hypothetical protein [Salmonella enterica]